MAWEGDNTAPLKHHLEIAYNECLLQIQKGGESVLGKMSTQAA